MAAWAEVCDAAAAMPGAVEDPRRNAWRVVALIASDPDVFFTIRHFDGDNAVLVHLDRISRERLGEAITDSWIAVAPKAAVRTFLDALG